MAVIPAKSSIAAINAMTPHEARQMLRVIQDFEKGRKFFLGLHIERGLKLFVEHNEEGIPVALGFKSERYRPLSEVRKIFEEILEKRDLDSTLSGLPKGLRETSKHSGVFRVDIIDNSTADIARRGFGLLEQKAETKIQDVGLTEVLKHTKPVFGFLKQVGKAFVSLGKGALVATGFLGAAAAVLVTADAKYNNGNGLEKVKAVGKKLASKIGDLAQGNWLSFTQTITTTNQSQTLSAHPLPAPQTLPGPITWNNVVNPNWAATVGTGNSGRSSASNQPAQNNLKSIIDSRNSTEAKQGSVDSAHKNFGR